jgi:RNA polymerase primary sigma factor
MLTEEQEVAIAHRIKKGDVDAMDILVKANLRFVVSVAKQYQNQGVSLNDLINEGNIGLIKAAYKFDETKGFKFISYAVWWIRQSILQALVEQTRIVRIPMNKAAFYSRITKISSDFQQDNYREPTAEEISEILGVKVDEIDKIKNGVSSSVSLDSPITDDDSPSLGELLEDVDSQNNPLINLLKDSLKSDIDLVLKDLTTREREILEYYFGLNDHDLSYSLDEIGSKLGLTRERVRQLRDKALRKVRRNCIALKMFNYME